MLPRFEIRPSSIKERKELNAWKEPAVGDKPSEWKWMQAVFARIDETPGKARYSETTARLSGWEKLPLADLLSDDIDLFESAKRRPPAGTEIPYPLRILSLPGEPIRLGDRRMFRALPRKKSQFEMFVACRYHFAEDTLAGVEVDLGGNNRICTLHLTRDELQPLVQENILTQSPPLLQFHLKGLLLEAKPEADLQRRFDAYLQALEDPRKWLFDHVQPKSGEIPKGRIAALLHDDRKIADWLKSVSDATNQSNSTEF